MIKVGEYVRTPEKGYIGKLVERIENALNYYKIDVGREIIHCDNSRDNYIYSREGFGLKHSKNIIDLIEVGDYVNGQKVIEVDSCKGAMREVYVEGQNPEKDCGLYFEQIETVVTKEQFANIEYRLEENK